MIEDGPSPINRRALLKAIGGVALVMPFRVFAATASSKHGPPRFPAATFNRNVIVVTDGSVPAGPMDEQCQAFEEGGFLIQMLLLPKAIRAATLVATAMEITASVGYPRSICPGWDTPMEKTR